MQKIDQEKITNLCEKFINQKVIDQDLMMKKITNKWKMMGKIIVVQKKKIKIKNKNKNINKIEKILYKMMILKNF